MRARAFVILWVVAALVATTIAWQGVSIVDSQVISPAPAISTARSSAAIIPVAPAPSATDVPVATATPSAAGDLELNLDLSSLADEPTTPPDDAQAEPESAEASEPGGEPGGAITPPTPRPTSEPRNTTAPTPTPTAAPTPRAQPSATPTVTPVPPTATPQPTPKPTVEPTQTLTFDLIGGTASVSFAPNEVHVLWATPEPGFSAEIGNSGPGQRVRFRSDDGESRLDVWWDAGPQWSIDEDHD